MKTVHRFVNLQQSSGDYFVDVDGNRVLDLNNPNALGYNHAAFVNERMTDAYDRFLQGRVDCTNLPPSDYADMLREVVMPVAPEGLNQVHLSDGSITSANETALSVALMNYAMKHKRNYQSLQVLGFENGSHGQSIATLSCSDKAVNHGNAPVYDWPQAPLPKLQYPLSANNKANSEEEQRCVDAFEQMVNDARAQDKDVGAVIVEPITQYQTKSATPAFYKKIRAICAREGIPFIVDETRTGFGQSAKMWAHEYWYLNENDGGCADMVTFGGKAGISGFYSTVDYRLNPHCASYDQDVDMVKLLNFGTAWKEMQYRNTLQYVHDTSSFLKIELNNIQRDNQGIISNVRGNGTFIGFDASDSNMADLIQHWLLKSGVSVLRTGTASFGLRPALTLDCKDAAHLRQALKYFDPNHANFE